MFALAMCLFIPACDRKPTASTTPGVGTRFQLPDGTTLTVVSISVGDRHPQPESVASASYATTNSSLGLWTRQTARPDHQWRQDLYLTVADESGVVHLPQGYGYYTSLTTNWSGDRLELHCFDAFPRRAATLTFFVHTPANNEWKVAGSFTLPNPARGPYPVWSPGPLPATRQNGDLALSLQSVAVRTNPAAADAGIIAQLSILSNGVAATGWRVESLRLMDATGNQMDLWQGDRECSVTDQGLFTATNRWLDPDEPAWKLQAEFSHQSGYGPAELAVITNLPATLDAPLEYGAFQTTLKHARVTVKGISRQSNPTGRGNNANVEVMVTLAPEDFRVALVKVTNERGQDIEVTRPPPNYGNFRGYTGHYFGLKLPADAKSINLTFAWQESRFAEFVFNPQIRN